jgi:hypothetical protein
VASPPLAIATTSAPSPVQIQAWTDFRRVYGLNTDLTWVVAVAGNPAAVRDLDVPLLQFESDHVAMVNANVQELVSTARGYGNRYPGEFAGAWIEGGQVIVAFTTNLPTHAAEANALFGARVLVRDARYSLAELADFVGTVEDEASWFATAGAELVDATADELLNAVRVQYRAPSQAVEPVIRARFADAAWLMLEYGGTGPWTGARGGIELTIVDETGAPVAVECLFRTVDPGVPGEPSPQDGSDGTCGYEQLPAVVWLVDITFDRDGQPATISKRYAIAADGVVRSTVVVDRAP